MKKIFLSYGGRLDKICCSIFGHHFVISKKITSHIKEYKCVHCCKQVSNDEKGHFTNLTPEVRAFNQELSQFHQRRKAHQHIA